VSEGAWRGAGARTRLSVPATWRATTFLSWCQIVQVSNSEYASFSPGNPQQDMQSAYPFTSPQRRATLAHVSYLAYLHHKVLSL